MHPLAPAFARVNQFKFDGTGDPTVQTPGSRFGSDFEAAIQLIQDLRRQKPDLFINLTTGTWPSPFWLRDADSIWRGGEDHAFAGVGSYRQQWITYRDGDTYREIASVCPLYPLNSLMLHGVLYAKHAHNLDPNHGDVYGWASSSPRKGILVLRNPSDQPAKIDIDIAKAFELPPEAPTKYHAQSPWQDEKTLSAVDLEAGKIHTFGLKPFEVVSLECKS